MVGETQSDTTLDFVRPFYFNGRVPAGDRLTSLREIGALHDGPVAFTTTHWSIVLTAQGRSPAADEALEKLCRIYWWPLYGFVRRQGYDPEEAQDLTQGFFANAFEKDHFARYDAGKASFQTFLRTCLDGFVANERKAGSRLKRGGDMDHYSLDFAVTIVRLLLFSTWRLALLERLRSSSDQVLAAIAEKGVKEMTYHRDYAGRWFLTLARGTDESRSRLLAARDSRGTGTFRDRS